MCLLIDINYPKVALLPQATTLSHPVFDALREGILLSLEVPARDHSTTK